MRFEAYAILLFSLALVSHLMGGTTLSGFLNQQVGGTCDTATGENCLMQVASQNSINSTLAIDQNPDEINQPNPSFITDRLIIQMLFSLGGAGILALLTGFGAIYILPLAILLAVVNLAVIPVNFILSPSMPPLFSIPLMVFFNLLAVFAVVNFVRGGS